MNLTFRRDPSVGGGGVDGLPSSFSISPGRIQELLIPLRGREEEVYMECSRGLFRVTSRSSTI